MPDYLDPRLGVTLSEAIAQSMASNVQNDPILITLELRCVNFRDEDGEEMSIYVVNDFEPLVANDEEGNQLTFSPVPFRYMRPEQTDGGAPAAVTVEVDNVSGILTQQLLLAGRAPVYVIEREYLPSDRTAPHVLPPTRMVLTGVRVTPTTVSGQLTFGDFSNRKFPFNTYTRELFRALAA